MKAALLVLLACAGCDKLFGVTHLDPQTDSGDDVADADIPTCLGGDEDCDGRKNIDDSCPADLDTKGDDDDDGVGNACDPETFGNEPNRIAFFDGFDDNSGNWILKSGDWQLGAGIFTKGTIGDSRVEKTITAKFPVLEVFVPRLSTVANGSVAILGSDQGSELRCKLTHRESDGMEFLEISAFLIQQEIPITGAGTLRLYGGQRQNGDFFCRARRGNNFDFEVAQGNAGPITLDTIAIETSSASTTISSVTLYGVQ